MITHIQMLGEWTEAKTRARTENNDIGESPARLRIRGAAASSKIPPFRIEL
jgi:hypothetical protein